MKRRKALHMRIFAGIAGVAALMVSLAARDGVQERPLRHDAAAVLKLVTVRVLGPDGRPVTELKVEDFALFEDGKRKTITEFESHSLSESGLEVHPPRSPEADAAAAEGRELNRKFFFFFDMQTSDEAGKTKAKDTALKFLETQAKPGDEAAVLGYYAMSGFFIREYLTDDLDLARKAIVKAIEMPPSRASFISRPPDEIEDRHDLPREADAPPIASLSKKRLEDMGGGRSFDKVDEPGSADFVKRDFMERLMDLVEIFKTIPGQKSLILFTSRDLGKAWEHLGKMLGDAGTAVFAVNTRDWFMSMLGAKVKQTPEDHSLKLAAEASGGKYFADINAAEINVREIQELTGHFYVLGYYVNESWDGKFHRIRVEVERPESRVLVQDGYFNPKPYEKLTDFEKEIRLVDLIWSDRPVSRPLTFPVEALALGTGKTPGVCLLSRFPIDPKTGAAPGNSEIYLLLRSESGTQIVSRKWDIDLAPFAGKSACPYLFIPLRPAAYDLRMVVRDRTTGESLVGRVRFEIPDRGGAGLRLSSPLFVEDSGTAVLMGLDMSAGRKSAVAPPRFRDLYPLMPQNGGPALGAIPAASSRWLILLPFEMPPVPEGDEPPIPAVHARLVSKNDEAGIPVEISVQGHKKLEDDSEILAAEILAPNVPPGEYELEIEVEDVGSDRRAVVRRKLTIR